MRMNEGDIQKLILPGMNTHFFKAVKEASPTWRQIADFIPSDQPVETYPWLGELPDPSEFNDERKRRKLNEYSWAITNKEFELTVGVKRSLIDDERYGQLNTLSTRIGQRFVRWFNKSVANLLVGGDSGLCYDGQYFFDTDHSEGKSGTQANKGTLALNSDNYAATRAAMMSFKDDQGEVIEATPNLLVVGAGLEVTAKQILRAQEINATTNVQAGTADVLVLPQLAGTNHWFLLDTTQDKPLILQERIPLEPGFEKYWNRTEIDYGAYWRGNFGYGNWRRAYAQLAA